MKKRIPDFKTDEEAEAFVEEADLSQYDFSDFKAFSFEFAPKSKSVTMRLPETLLDAVKARAAEKGIPYQRLIRQTLEREVARLPALSKVKR
ncbi:CopG family antitoxin [uncultured Alsobacter sp.]|uniref:CopG family antitoxin n=1 Tax=uncultured Alsobacter sp. TaxID=1748258 RepID=UPI0025D76275|nr:CopG family antitoxin [uncultured Alsobacter sp.]